MTIIDPRQLREARRASPPSLEAVTVNGERVNPAAVAAVRERQHGADRIRRPQPLGDVEAALPPPARRRRRGLGVRRGRPARQLRQPAGRRLSIPRQHHGGRRVDRAVAVGVHRRSAVLSEPLVSHRRRHGAGRRDRRRREAARTGSQDALRAGDRRAHAPEPRDPRHAAPEPGRARPRARGAGDARPVARRRHDVRAAPSSPAGRSVRARRPRVDPRAAASPHGHAAARRVAGAARRRHRDAARCPPDGGRRGTPPGQRVAGRGPAAVPHRAGGRDQRRPPRTPDAHRHQRLVRRTPGRAHDRRRRMRLRRARADEQHPTTTSTSAWSRCASAPSRSAASCASRACRARGPRCVPSQG